MSRSGPLRTRRSVAAIAAATTLAGLGFAASAPPAFAGPVAGSPWVVSVGDSAISGEAGRWAGNTNGSSSTVDALGSTAYYDNASNTAELIPGCHRSKSAEIYLGGGVSGTNLACSGARTGTAPYASGSDFKPGLDFYDDGAGHQGQALLLQQFAATHNVQAVTVMIGANNFNFASILQTCVQDFLLSPSWWPNYCYDDSSVSKNFTSTNVAAQTTAIATAVGNTHRAMANAGYTDADYTIVVQTYWDPIPYGSQFRYSQSGYTRQSVGGCGLWNKDANWANDSALPTINAAVRNGAAQSGVANVKILDIAGLLTGHRLCENTVGLLEEVGLSSWTQSGAADRTEWISQIRTVSTITPPYQLQEDSHTNYWGQLAMRNCLRQSFNGGAVRPGSCTATAGGGLNALGEPNVTLN